MQLILITRRLCATRNANPPQSATGLNLGKPKALGTPDDYQFEQSIPDTPMTRKFGHLRGLSVKTVSETVSDFYDMVSDRTLGVSGDVAI